MSKVLVVDDESSFESTLNRLMVIHSLEVDWCRHPSDFLKSIKNEHELIILDIMMPLDPEIANLKINISVDNEDGLETGIILYYFIRQNYPNKKVIFSSARGEEILKKYGLYEINDYIKYFQKPYDTNGLFETIINNI